MNLNSSVKPTKPLLSSKIKLFIIDFELHDYSGHHFNQLSGFRQAALQSDILPIILVPVDADDEIADQLNAIKIIHYDKDKLFSTNPSWTDLVTIHRQLKSLWLYLDKESITEYDMVLINTGLPTVVYSLGCWFGGLTQRGRPAVFVRFYNVHFYINTKTLAFTPNKEIYEFIGNDLNTRNGQENIFFVLNNEQLIPTLERAFFRKFFYLPLPKHQMLYQDKEKNLNKDPVIYLHLNGRADGTLFFYIEVIEKILAKYPKAKFLIKHCSENFNFVNTPFSKTECFRNNIEIIPSKQTALDYVNTLDRCNLVLLPYKKECYKILTSGVFCEAASLSKIVIVPNDTFMAGDIKTKKVVGFHFDKFSQEEIVQVLEAAIQNLNRLLKKAKRLSREYRATNSCHNNLQLMLKLAQSQKNSTKIAPCRPGTAINFHSNGDARCYMKEGWSFNETQGTWTVGNLATLEFLLEQIPLDDLRICFSVTPFVAIDHEQKIKIFINDALGAQWKFYPDVEIFPCKRYLIIPAYFFTSKDLRINFHIETHASPLEYGLSEDSRELGLLMHDIEMAYVRF